MKDWDAVAAFALTLPGTALSTSYGKPAVRVRGKAFVYPGREPGSFCVASPLEEKEFLMATDPHTFWESPHYRGWPAVLVRHEGEDMERARLVTARAWWDRASMAQRTAFGPRP